jgi:uncharacterized protein YggU (UPF0235/DUF167 family)
MIVPKHLEHSAALMGRAREFFSSGHTNAQFVKFLAKSSEPGVREIHIIAGYLIAHKTKQV